MNLLATITKLFPAGGFYLEAGAHDGVGDSNTYALELAGGWSGLCVEPSSAFNGLSKSRSCKVDNRCLWNKDNEWITFREVQGEAIELSGILSTFRDFHDRATRPYKDLQRRTVSLTTLLRQHSCPSVIQFFCLDTEGSELEILEAHDFDAFRFEFMIVEHNNVLQKRDAIRELLASKDMVLLEVEGIDDYFVRRGLDVLSR